MSSLPRLSILTFKGCTSNVSCKRCALSRACSRRPVGDALPARQTHQRHASHREAATAIAAKLPSTLLFSLPGSKATFPGHGKRSTATRFDCPGNRPLGTHFLTRSGRRVLVHREHVSGNVRAHPARAGAFPCRQFFPAHQRAGVDSVPLVGLVSFFLGLTMALLTGYQLQRFGTERLIPGLVAIGFTRELGPLLTGIMLAARIGAAFTAELGTMQVSEEVEAIESMGIGPLRFLVAPRMLALIL